jgi:hypothetical protein
VAGPIVDFYPHTRDRIEDVDAGDPCRALRSCQSLVDRVGYRRRACGYPQFAVDVLQVMFNRFPADDETLPNLRIAQPVRQELKHLDLSLRQAI